MEQLKPYTKTDASNIGNNLSYKADGTAVTDDDKTINKNAWGAAIGTGVIADPTESKTNHSATNGSQQLVTGGTVYTALQNQKTDLTKDLSVSAAGESVLLMKKTRKPER